MLSSHRDKVHTSSGNHTPGCELPSRTARTNAAVEYPTDLKMDPKRKGNLFELSVPSGKMTS